MEEFKRSLAHIEKIVAIRPIEGADNIEVASVLGWECVVLKSEGYKPDQFVVYVEVDSIMPEKPEYEFLRPRKFRIRTIKLRKTVSQGLVLPLSVLPSKTYNEGEDVTEILGIKHHDPESSLNQKEAEFKPQNRFLKFLLRFWIGRKIILPFIRKPKGSWPSWVVKTDEQRLANIPSVLTCFDDKYLYVTEKLDGSSFSAFYRKLKFRGIFGICSRNVWLKHENDSHFWLVSRKYDLEKILKNHFRKTGEELTIQGECVGPNIQKNKYELKDFDLFVFNIVNNRTNKFFNIKEIKEFCLDNKLKTVPILDEKFKQKNSVTEMTIYSQGKSLLNPEIEREGIVVRLIEEGIKKISYKQISPNFLLKNDE